MKSIRNVKWICVFIVILLVACNPARKLPSGEYLLVSNKLIVKGQKIDTEELEYFIKQKPNHKTLGLYFNLRVYNMASGGKKDTRFKRWLRNAIGEPPSVLDTMQVDNSLKQMGIYLDNHGYFNSVLRREITDARRKKKSGPFYSAANKKKKAKVGYYITVADPYIIRNVYWEIEDSGLKGALGSSFDESAIVKGEPYNVDKLDEERDRISRELLMKGYFYFSKEYINYEIDTNLGIRALDIYATISQRQVPFNGNQDSIIRVNHRQYRVENVIINTDYNFITADTTKYDTIRTVIAPIRKNRLPKTYHFVYNKKLKVKFKSITQSVYVDSSDIYTIKDVDNTFNQLSRIRLFRYVNVVMQDLNDTVSEMGKLNCIILLTRAPVQAFSIDVVTTNTGGQLGLSSNLVYENKNLFRGTEIFNIRLHGAVEIQKLNFKASEDEEVLKNVPFFNTVEYGIETGLIFNRFLLPVNQEKFSKSFRPKTSVNAGYNYQQRPDYTRYITRGLISYEWKESEAKTHILTPWEFNTVSIFPDSAFAAQIASLKDRLLQNTYKDHIITAMRYTYIYNTQKLNRNDNFMWFRGDLEVAGFLFWTLNNIRGKQGSYSLYGIPYSQYLRLNLDYRYYFVFNNKISLVTRASGGYGMPLDKYNVLPFEKSYYLGGANSMRGWRFKTLGPGGYVKPDSIAGNFDRIGEIGLEANIEFRFPIYGILNGAIFLDAGNVWLRKETEQYPEGEISGRRFASEIAFDGGLGARLNFGFLIVRLDGAVVLKDPALSQGNRWFYQNDNKTVIIGSLGIGYPF